MGMHPSTASVPGYTGDGWTIVEAGAPLARSEAVFTLGNGFIGVRGVLEEQEGRTRAAVAHLNGVYERVPIHYHETLPGLARSSDTRVPVPDGTRLEVLVAGERFGRNAGTVLAEERRLDLRSGLLTRRVLWRSPKGQTAEIVFERLVSFVRDRLAAARVTVTPVDFDGPVLVESALEAPRSALSQADQDDPRVGPALGRHGLKRRRTLTAADGDGFIDRAADSGHGVATLMAHAASDAPAAETSYDGQDRLLRGFRFEARTGVPVSLTKLVAYAADRGGDQDAAEDDEALAGAARAVLADAAAAGFDRLLEEQRGFLADFWQRADLALEGDAEADRAVRFAMLQLLQAAGRDGLTSVGAKGQSGEGYEGHYFWDAEIFVLPFFTFTAPEIARRLLEYRVRMLDGARAHARVMGHAAGALFPWRTIGGQECSAYFPGGSAQYHINADIAYAVRQYVEATEDDGFLLEGAAELVFETARIWTQVGFHNPRRGGQFCINEVTGPDEYTAMVDNNLYTNAMAKAHLEYACDLMVRLSLRHPEALADLRARIALTDAEVAAWRDAAERMYLPYDAELDLHPQDDGFLDKPVWDVAGTPPGRRPLLLHYHPLTLYRHQLCKQADAVLAFFLLPERFAPSAKRNSYDYYERITVHDSTLSASVFGIMAAELGDAAKAYDYVRASALVDLEDLHGNTGHGLHMASLAGAWMGVVHGFAGMRTLGGDLRFRPILPDALTGYRFRLVYRNSRLAVTVAPGAVTYTLLGGGPLELWHHGRLVRLDASAPEAVVPADLREKEPS